MLLALVPVPLDAQATTSHPALDSASVARAAWGRMNAARRTGDLTAARTEALRAATAWPTQPAYQWGRAVLAARTGDTAGALAALHDYAALGLGRDLASDSSIAALRVAPGFDAVRAAHDRNRAPIARGVVLREVRDSTLWPEGVDHDRRSRQASFSRASAAARSCESPATAPRASSGPTARTASARCSAFESMPRVGASGRRRPGSSRWRATRPRDSAIAALLLVDPGTGRIERRWDLPVIPGGHVLGDVALGPRGEVWVTDSNEPVLYRLRPGADTLDRFRHPLFRSLQGMAPSSDGRFVYVADYSHGLLRVRVSDGSVIRLPDAPGSTSLGCDGIVLHRGAIVAVQNGVAPPRIVRFTLNAAGDRIVAARVLDQQPALAPEPTIGTMVGNDFVYVATSQWETHDESGRRLPGAPLPAARLIAVPVDDATR